MLPSASNEKCGTRSLCTLAGSFSFLPRVRGWAVSKVLRTESSTLRRKGSAWGRCSIAVSKDSRHIRPGRSVCATRSTFSLELTLQWSASPQPMNRPWRPVPTIALWNPHPPRRDHPDVFWSREWEHWEASTSTSPDIIRCFFFSTNSKFMAA